MSKSKRLTILRLRFWRRTVRWLDALKHWAFRRALEAASDLTRL